LVGGGLEGAGVTIPSAAFTLGFRDDGGQHLTLVNMQRLFPIWGIVTPAMVSTQLIPLTDDGNLLGWGRLTLLIGGDIMPGFDGTGPRGMGSMTGGGRGFCSPWGIGAAHRGYGISPGIGYGYPYYRGAGVPSPFYGAPVTAPGATPFASPMTGEQELDFLRNQAQAVKEQLEQIEAKMRELKKKEK